MADRKDGMMLTQTNINQELGLSLQGTIHHNLTTAQLVEKALERGEGDLTSTGAFRATTGSTPGAPPKINL